MTNEEKIAYVAKGVELLKIAPESQLDHAMLPLIEKWSVPPKPIEVLEVLDKSVNGALASDLVMTMLNVIYVCSLSNTTHEEVVKGAIWRNE